MMDANISPFQSYDKDRNYNGTAALLKVSPYPDLVEQTACVTNSASSTQPLLAEKDAATATSHSEHDDLDDAVHLCQACRKEFNRLCDLNKHTKSHSRPFKCAFSTCKYYTLGWPTAKELERHVNDKHSAAPRTYACLFPPCQYQSKRESNCKQHMEKTHGWQYVRSKCNSKSRQGCTADQDLPVCSVDNPYPTPTSPGGALVQAPKADFLLFPSDAHYLEDQDLEDAASQDSKVFIPWTSPGSRFRKNQTFLQRFTQAYDAPESSLDGEDLLIDPQLSRVGLEVDVRSTYTVNRARVSSSLEVRTTTFNSTTNLSNTSSKRVRSVVSFPQPHSSELAQASIQQWPNGQAQEFQGPTVGGGDVESSNAATDPVGLHIPEAGHLKRRERDDDEGNQEPTPKRNAPQDRPAFKDSEMPDIFHSAHPHIYHRDQKALYSSCHSSHKDISTLVRHLGRAPHRLDAQERYVSSFHVEDQGHTHAKAAVCKRCWQTFYDCEDFQHHLTKTCDKISKGKKQKWQILYEAFTPIIQVPAAQSIPSNAAISTLAAAIKPRRTSCTATVEENSPSDSPQSPATVDLTLGPLHQHVRDGFVPIEEHLRLCGRVEHLERMISAVAPWVRRIERPNTFLRAIEQAGISTPSATTRLMEAPEHVWSDGSDCIQITSEDQPDRESLVGHMNSQPTDVDREGLIDEAQGTLTRASSGISSVRSTIHHVPSSPPARYEGYQANIETRDRRSNNGGLIAQVTPGGHQPTSIPDSGYWSDKKRGSLGDVDLAEQIKMPPSFSEEARQEMQEGPGQNIVLPQQTDPKIVFGSEPNTVDKDDKSQKPSNALDSIIDEAMWGSGAFSHLFADTGETTSHHLSDYDAPDPLAEFTNEQFQDMFRSPESQELENHEFPLDTE